MLLNRRSEAFELIQKLSNELNSEQWLSTQTTAYSLMAVSRYAETEKSDKSIEMEYNHAGKSEQVNSRKAFWKTSLGKLSRNGSMEVKNKGKNVIFVQMSSTGIPSAGQERASQNRLKIETVFTGSEGKDLDVEKMQQGVDFTAYVKITNISAVRERIPNIALTQIFPSGWEIMNTRLLGLEESSNYEYCDIRDDRVYTYFHLGVGETKIFKVKLNVAYAGRFYMPAVKAEAMYDGSINANTEGKWVETAK